VFTYKSSSLSLRKKYFEKKIYFSLIQGYYAAWTAGSDLLILLEQFKFESHSLLYTIS